MKEEYDFAGMESRSNPYAARLKTGDDPAG